MKLTAILIITTILCLPCLAEEREDKDSDPVDMCHSLYGWVPCAEDMESIHACFDRSSSFNCLECTISMALLRAIDTNEKNLVDITANCLIKNFPAETWVELEHWDQDYVHPLGLTLSAKDVAGILEASVYIAQFNSYDLVCKDKTEGIPEDLSSHVTFWNEHTWDDRSPLPVMIAESALKEHLQAQAFLFSYNCLAFYPRNRSNSPIYFKLREGSEEELGSALTAFLAHQKITTIAVIKDSPEQVALEAKGWKIRASDASEQFATLLCPPIEYHFL